MSIQINYQLPFRLKDVTKVKHLLRTLTFVEGFSIDNLSIVFVSDEFLYELNLKYLNHDFYTDIITFDYSTNSSKVINGELYISLDRAKDNAKNIKVTIQAEVKRLIIHGLLHLCGYEDANPQAKQVMTQKEDFYLNLL
jgi:rRNA maturation RNase YbeY